MVRDRRPAQAGDVNSLGQELQVSPPCPEPMRPRHFCPNMDDAPNMLRDPYRRPATLIGRALVSYPQTAD